MRITIIASGSRGDIEPYIALGKGDGRCLDTQRDEMLRWSFVAADFEP